MQANFNLELPKEFEKQIQQSVINVVTNTIGSLKTDSKYPEYMDKGQCAAYLNLSRSTFDKWLKTENIPVVVIKGAYRFKKSEIDKFMLAKQK
ncbi:MAG: helix-turn-helix domain-containing protein [Liquorilactobacillus nagelii]|jgi:excisionase family DNA binding protein|uniref:helix-turn-helix transcriptional regulator n=1 Tax=Liquorilactobacillus nagelii TaxID=82688 RepID=UPI00242C8D01|nr:helix-turn-helix domain-containing protein [Liquorilactobacillus nagelii]MCI1633704.1 helix-turn-helix domain-containing protein [Liquorilactobacillus nagelii]